MEVHLPCPPLVDWLPARLGGRVPLILADRGVPRRLRRMFGRLRMAAGEGAASDSARGLIWITGIDGSPPPAEAVAAIGAGSTVVEFAVVPPRLLRELMGLGLRPEEAARYAQRRVGHFLRLGLWEIEQWSSVDPDELLVTVGRARAVAP